MTSNLLGESKTSIDLHSDRQIRGLSPAKLVIVQPLFEKALGFICLQPFRSSRLRLDLDISPSQMIQLVFYSFRFKLSYRTIDSQTTVLQVKSNRLLYIRQNNGHDPMFVAASYVHEKIKIKMLWLSVALHLCILNKTLINLLGNCRRTGAVYYWRSE